jgi:hypothetical protein
VARLYAATGDGFARLAESGEAWTVELSLSRSGDGGRSWIDCEVPERAVFSLAVSAADGGVYVGTDGRLFAGLADDKLWESRDRGDNWTVLQLGGDTLDALVALDHATR